jgi:peptidyl-tRNA hydrolase
LMCFASPKPVKFFWIIHKIIGFVGVVVVHLLLGLVINKIYKKRKSKNKSKKTWVRQTWLDWFCGWSKVSRCKKKNQKKTENYTKSNKISNIDHLFPRNGLLTAYNRIKHHMDLQAGKSPVVVKGPFFSRVVDPRYQIRGANVWCKSWSNKSKKLRSSRGETYASNLKEHHKNESNLLKTGGRER